MMDLQAAQIVGAGGFEPQRWDTEPPGLVNPPSVRARAQINVALLPDPEDRLTRESLPGWVQIVSYDRMLGEPPERDCRDDDLPVALVADCRREFEHIIRHDPRNAVADCEAKLSILAEHRLVIADRGEGAHPAYRIVNENPDAGAVEDSRRIWDADCRACRVHYPCRTVRLMASGYRNRANYREAEWKP